jgi:hypothetical protein
MKKMTQICPDLGNEGTTIQIARFLQQVPADSQILEENVQKFNSHI